jgi:hypothetical protein
MMCPAGEVCATSQSTAELVLIYVLLALAIVVALIGIVNL